MATAAVPTQTALVAGLILVAVNTGNWCFAKYFTGRVTVFAGTFCMTAFECKISKVMIKGFRVQA